MLNNKLITAVFLFTLSIIGSALAGNSKTLYKCHVAYNKAGHINETIIKRNIVDVNAKKLIKSLQHSDVFDKDGVTQFKVQAVFECIENDEKFNSPIAEALEKKQPA